MMGGEMEGVEYSVQYISCMYMHIQSVMLSKLLFIILAHICCMQAPE